MSTLRMTSDLRRQLILGAAKLHHDDTYGRWSGGFQPHADCLNAALNASRRDRQREKEADRGECRDLHGLQHTRLVCHYSILDSQLQAVDGPENRPLLDLGSRAAD